MAKKNINLNDYIVQVENFPIRGVVFSDISKLIECGASFSYAVDELVKFVRPLNPTKIVGIEARGFLFGTPIAYQLGIGFASIRKPNKLPRIAVTASANIEYGKRELSIHRDSLEPGEKVVIVDDILATGGSVKAAIELVNQLKANVVGICFLGRIASFNGDKILTDYKNKWLIDL